ncbi:tetratricopeptide repeat protein [Tepidamorphus sp. 3E244]|uniref:tetratricopeptide repeat protein n=1 Tax=Tepidamorphus sp. 3E244 TaxID=3385498 RepID=UPI0038FC79B7
MTVHAMPIGRAKRLAAAIRALCVAVGVVMSCLVVFAVSPAQAQQPAKVEALQGNGFGRLIFTFPEPMKIKLRATPGVVVLNFPKSVKLDVAKVPTTLSAYIGAARTDPDGKGARFALAAAYNVNMMEAAEKVIVDLLPTTWQGLPPALPQEIIDELAERARNTEQRRAEERKASRIASAKPINVRIGELATFTRLVFDWGEPTAARVERDGERVTADFQHPGKINAGALKARMPEWVTDVSSGFSADGGLRVQLSVDPLANVRGFPEGDTYIIDVTNPDWAGARNPLETRPVEETAAGGLSVAVSNNQTVSEPDDKPEAPAIRQSQQPFAPDNYSATAMDEPSGDVAIDGSSTAADQAIAELSATRPKPKAVQPAATAAKSKSEPEPDMTGDRSVDAFSAAARVTPEVRLSGSLVNIKFPFHQPTASAVVARGKHVWIAFDLALPVDIRVLRQDLQSLVKDVDYSRSGMEQLIRLTLRDNRLVSSSLEENSWVVSLGDLVLSPPRPLNVERTVNEKNEGVVDIDLVTANSVRDIEDPDRGTTMKVVTAFGPPRAVYKPQDFVEFQVEPTIHGALVQPLADDVDVAIVEQGVRITRSNGLTLSGGGPATYESASRAMGNHQRPGYVSIENEELSGDDGIAKLIARTQQAVTDLPEEERTAGRLRLARLYLASDLAAEGLGMLRYAQDEDPQIGPDPSFRALLGVSSVLMGRGREALREFDTFKLGDSGDISLWRGLAHMSLADWPSATLAFIEGEPAIGGYSSRRQLEFRLAAGRVALEVGDMEMATRNIGAAEALVGNVEADGELLMLWGWLNERSGRSEQALAAYGRAAKSGDRKLEAETTLRMVSLQHRTGAITIDEAIDKLEALAISWRGDAIELSTLATLSKLYVEKDDFRRAFELMKVAAISDADSPITRALESELDGVFADLFISGKTGEMPPIEALALYYDFREMTPVGERGDAMIRALADRLIEVDLLAQAAQLLEHQVDNRLHGAARAQIAAKLALVHLMNRKPEKALAVLVRTRQAVLPQDVKNQRTVLEARALSETGRADLAVDLLSTVEGNDVARLKADALWQAEDWQSAGDELDRLLERRWADSRPLTESERYDVMRMAIAYSLAGDNLGLGRVRSKFAGLMAGTRDSTAFDVVTGGLPEAAGNIREVVASIASTDTLDAFIDEYKTRFEISPQPSS